MSQLIENIVSKKENEKYYWLTIGQRIWLKVSEFYIIFKMKTYFIDLYVQYFQKRKFNFQGYIDTSNLKKPSYKTGKRDIRILWENSLNEVYTCGERITIWPLFTQYNAVY